MVKFQKIIGIFFIFAVMMNFVTCSIHYFKKDPNRKYVSLEQLKEIVKNTKTNPNDVKTDYKIMVGHDGYDNPSSMIYEKFNSQLSTDKNLEFYKNSLRSTNWHLIYTQQKADLKIYSFCKNEVSLNLYIYDDKTISYYERLFQWTDDVQSDDYCK